MSALLDNPVVQALATGQATDGDGQAIPVHSQIPLEFAHSLYEQVLLARPQLVIEIGMAFGMSSLAILSALERLGEGRLISIDPMQSSQWKKGGVESVRRAGLAHRHTLLEEYDYLALPRLLAGGTKAQFCYIDGWHTFDYALLDFWYADKLLAAGGVVAFNDCAMPAVRKVIRFALSHRKYEEVRCRVTPMSWTYRARSLVTKLRSGGNYEDRYFRKLEQWEPTWNFFRQF